jgi:putative transposase
MRNSRFNERQIIGVLREQESGATTAEVCRRHGISEQTFYRWKAKYGGMGPSDAQRLKSLEDENRRLKKLLAEAMLDVAALKDLVAKNVWSAPPRKAENDDRGGFAPMYPPLASGLIFASQAVMRSARRVPEY